MTCPPWYSLGTSITSCNNFHLKASEMELYDMLTSQPGLGTKKNRSLWSVTQRRRVANSQHRAAGSLRYGALHTCILDLRASASPPFTWETPLPLQLSYRTEVPSMALSTLEAPSADSFNDYAQGQPAPERGVDAANKQQYSKGKDHQY